MKTYEKLTKAEREKLSLYLQYLNAAKTRAAIIVGCSFVFIALGIPLLLLTTYPMVIFTGFFCFLYGIMFMLTGVSNLLYVRKNLFLIFGYKDSFEDVFGITRADLRKIKMTKEVKWIWRKEE